MLALRAFLLNATSMFQTVATISRGWRRVVGRAAVMEMEMEMVMVCSGKEQQTPT
jgi:hypothetical protein